MSKYTWLLRYCNRVYYTFTWKDGGTEEAIIVSVSREAIQTAMAHMQFLYKCILKYVYS